jgi:hypothetical protein
MIAYPGNITSKELQLQCSKQNDESEKLRRPYVHVLSNQDITDVDLRKPLLITLLEKPNREVLTAIYCRVVVE